MFQRDGDGLRAEVHSRSTVAAAGRHAADFDSGFIEESPAKLRERILGHFATVAVQDALADANTADKPVEIRVAQGTYTPDRGRGIEKGDSDAAFRLVGGVTLVGGYAGLGGTDPNERDPAKYLSLLSGDLDDDDVPVQNPKQLLDDSTHLLQIGFIFL